MNSCLSFYKPFNISKINLMKFILFLSLYIFTRSEPSETNQIEVNLKPNEKKKIDLSDSLFVYINSYNFFKDDFKFNYYENATIDKYTTYSADQHRSFREGSLEIVANKEILFKGWKIPSTLCPKNNYVINSYYNGTFHVSLKSLPHFCFFTQMNIPFLGIQYKEASFAQNSNKIFLIENGANTIYNLSKSILYSISSPSLVGYSETYPITFQNGGFQMSFSFANGNKCNFEPIHENGNEPEDFNFDIKCEKYRRTFNMWLLMVAILILFALLFYSLMQINWIRPKQFFYQTFTPQFNSNLEPTQRVEEHLVIEESPETINDQTNPPNQV